MRDWIGGVGVIRDYSGATILNNSGPVGAMDTNEAKIYSLLIGCRKLKCLFGFKIMVEGDSKLAVLGGSSGEDYPWCFTDWVEEIHSISSLMSFISLCFS